MATDEQIQEKYMQLQMLAQTLQQLQQQLAQLSEQESDLARVIEGLGDLSSAKPGARLLVPLAEGLFARATLDGADELLVNVGSNVVVGKSAPQAKELLERRAQELREHRERMDAQMGEVVQAAQQLQHELSEMVSGSGNV